VLARHVKYFTCLKALEFLFERVEFFRFGKMLKSPVCRTNSGGVGNALIFAIAFCNVPMTSLFASLLNPMWLSLISAKLKSPPISGAVAPSSFDVSTPPLIVQSTLSARPRHAFEEPAAIDAIGIVVM
jgi:hypothetical protein